LLFLKKKNVVHRGEEVGRLLAIRVAQEGAPSSAVHEAGEVLLPEPSVGKKLTAAIAAAATAPPLPRRRRRVVLFLDFTRRVRLEIQKANYGVGL